LHSGKAALGPGIQVERGKRVERADEMENREVEYYLQTSVLKPGICDLITEIERKVAEK